MFLFRDLAHLDLIHSERLVVRRKAKALGDGCVVVDGKRVHREAVESFEIAANVQPMSGKDLQMLPEGDYVTEGLTIWQGRDSGPVIGLSDQIVRHGKTYEIRTANEWGPYVQAQAAFISQGPER